MSISVRIALVTSAIFLATSITAAAMFSTAAPRLTAPLGAVEAQPVELTPVYVSPAAAIDLEACSPADL